MMPNVPLPTPSAPARLHCPVGMMKLEPLHTVLLHSGQLKDGGCYVLLYTRFWLCPLAQDTLCLLETSSCCSTCWCPASAAILGAIQSGKHGTPEQEHR